MNELPNVLHNKYCNECGIWGINVCMVEYESKKNDGVEWKMFRVWSLGGTISNLSRVVQPIIEVCIRNRCSRLRPLCDWVPELDNLLTATKGA